MSLMMANGKRVVKRMKTAVESSQNRADLRHVKSWIFDLDNTLYSADANIFAQVDQRMTEYIARVLEVDEDEAHRRQKLYYNEYGTTLSGLMSVYDVDPKEFLDFVHDIDVSSVLPDHALDEALSRLEGRKVIYTNGSHQHAVNVLGSLGITHHFSDIYDIVFADYIPKPNKSAYEHILDKSGIDPKESVMFEDLPQNLEAAHVLGMTTVWVRPTRDATNHPHIKYATHDLVKFLTSAHLPGTGA